MFLTILYQIITFATVHTSNHICNNPFQCDFETIQCTDNEPCFIECSDNFSCKYATIICPKNDICNIQCVGNTKRNQCEYMNITATHSTMLILNASSINDVSPKTMRNSYIHCPYTNNNNNTISNGLPKCLLNCNGDDLMKKSIIYAVNGFDDILIASTDSCYKNVAIQCNKNYTANCVVSNDKPYRCLNEFSECQPITTYNPTLEPTLNPTLEPTIIMDVITSTIQINREYSTTNILHILDTTFISWHNNTFMTVIVASTIVISMILLAICIVCYKQIVQIKNEQIEIEDFAVEPGMNRHNEFDYDDNEQLGLNRNVNEGIHMHRTEINEHIGEYDIVLADPNDSDYD